MIQNIIDGIIKAIRTEYDKSFRVYTESVEQGLIEPCFSILCLKPSGEHEIGDRFKRFFPFVITYFPSSDEPMAECNTVCETLLGLLNDVETDIGLFHGSEMSGEVVDGNLQFTVQYQTFARLVRTPVDDMGDLTIDTSAT